MKRSAIRGLRDGRCIPDFAALHPGYNGSPLLCCNWRQFEYTTMLGCFGYIAATQSQSDGVKLARIVGRQVRRPSGIVFDQIDGYLYLGGILALMDELF
jgi:hypothetical protein